MVVELNGGAKPLHSEKSVATVLNPDDVIPHENCCDDNCDKDTEGSLKDGDETNSLGSWKDGVNGCSEPVSEASASGLLGESPSIGTPSTHMSWADMAQEDELGEEEEQQELNKRVVDINASTGRLRITKVVDKPKLSREQREHIRFMNVQRKKDFICLERVKGKFVNILEGLELHMGIFSAAEQKRIVEHVYELQEMGKKGQLKGLLSSTLFSQCHSISMLMTLYLLEKNVNQYSFAFCLC